MEKDIRNSLALKTICFISIPIFIIILFASLVYASYVASTKDILQTEDFYKTEIFSDIYSNNIDSVINRIKNKKIFTKINNDLGETIYFEDNYYNASETQVKYLIVTKDKTAYTNYILEGSTDTIEKIIQKLNQNRQYYWNYNKDKKQVNTNVTGTEELKYTYSDLNNETSVIPYDVYTVLDENNKMTSSIYFAKTAFSLAKSLKEIPIVMIPISSILLLVMIIYLCFAIGHKKGHEGIYTTNWDKTPIDVLTALIILILGMVLSLAIAIGNNGVSTSIEFTYYITMYLLVFLFCYAISLVWAVTVIKRIKTKTFWKTTLIYRLGKKIIGYINKLAKRIFDNFDTNNKIIFAYLLIILISIILCSVGGIWILLAFAFWAYVLYKIIGRVNQYRKIQDTIRDIYEGKTDIKLDENQYTGELKNLSIYVNDIAGGFSNAIAESLKSERFKTELITNVSHDIKTPLTSIINYVDLLKQEDIPNETAKGYINILEQKSQRLKKLTEDLVEASKASSGNVKLQIEEINLKELINQTIGEFKDRFEEKSLNIETKVPKEEIKIHADNRYLYRVIENLFSNITKYALENSRVYIDIIKKNDKVLISIKNISKDKLNISSEELMQRFVRGDKSRTTEGSGLGLSIAKSLTELQNGKFITIIDGDLFKVELIFDII